MGKHNKIITN